MRPSTSILAPAMPLLSRSALPLSRPLSSAAYLRPYSHSHSQLRLFSTTPFLSVAPNTTLTPTPTPARAATRNSKNKKNPSDRPFKIEHKPVFPPPVNPFAPVPKPKQYSDLTLRLLWRLNRILGYNRRRRTSARETQRMVGGILEAVEADKAFWYGECNLPKTFHTFYSIHVVYVLLTLTRLRALPNYVPNPLSPLPQPRLPGPPGLTPPARRPTIGDTLDNMVSKSHDERYQEQLLTHFFAVLENEIRLMLGPNAQDREIKRIMIQYQTRYNLARLGLDYALALGRSDVVEEREAADSELAGWVWREVFARRGEGENGEGELVWPEGESMKEGKDLEMAGQIEAIVRFMRRELARLEGISDRDVIAGNVAYWSKVRS